MDKGNFSLNYDDTRNVVANGSSSMYSGSISQEVNVVDIYKKKIQRNIFLKRKNLKIIRFLFLFSLFCFVTLACILDIGFRSNNNYVFKDNYLNALITFQQVISKMVCVDYVAQFNHIFVNNPKIATNSTLVNSTDPKTSTTSIDTLDSGNSTSSVNLTNSINSTNSTTSTAPITSANSQWSTLITPVYNFEDILTKYFNDAQNSLVQYLEQGSEVFMIKQNSLNDFLNDWDSWKVTSENSLNMDFMSLLKTMKVSLFLQSFKDPNIFPGTVMQVNTADIIEKLLKLEIQLGKDFDVGYKKMSNFLIWLIVARFSKKRAYVFRHKRFDDCVFHKGAEKLELRFHTILKNQK